MPYAWPITAAHRPGGLLAPHRFAHHDSAASGNAVRSRARPRHLRANRPARMCRVVRPPGCGGGSGGWRTSRGPARPRRRGCRAPRTGGWRRARWRGGSRSAAGLGLPVEVEHHLVVPADDEQRGRGHRGQPRTGQVGTAAAGHDRRDAGAGFGGGPQRGRGPGAGAEVTDRQAPASRGWARSQPVASASRRASRLDVEHVGPVELLLRGEQVEQQRAQAGLIQDARRRNGCAGCAGCCRCRGRTPRSRRRPPARSGGRPAGPPGAASTSSPQDRRTSAPRRRQRGCRGGPWPGRRRCRALQAGDDLIVGGLGEISVKLADGEEVLGGVARRPTRRQSRADRGPATGGATGTASTTRAAPCARATWQAARAVDPVAMPSSTTTATRPASGSRGRSAR